MCSESGDYISAPSLPILVPKEDLVYVLGSGKMTTDESEITSSATSLSSMEDEEEEKELFSPAKRGILEGGEEIEAVDGVGVSNGVSTSPPPLPSSADNGKELQSDDHTGKGFIHVIIILIVLMSLYQMLANPVCYIDDLTKLRSWNMFAM